MLELDRKVKNLLFYKKNIHRNSTRSKILEMMYPDVKLTIGQITLQIANNKPYHYTKKIILQMQLDGYLFSDEKKYNKTYHLSQIGRWFAICVKLDHISFQSLCILSQEYCRVKRDPNDKTNYYMISKFRDKLDKSHDTDESCASAVYTSRNISQSIKILTNRNLLYWANDDFVKISSDVLGYLQKHDEDFVSLVSWQSEMFDECRKIQFGIVMRISEKKKFFSLAKSMI